MNKKPLSKAVKALYGVGGIGFAWTTMLHAYLGAFFITDVAKLPASSLTVIQSMNVIVAAVCMPVIGAVMSKMKPGKWGKTRKLLVIFPALYIIPFSMCYTAIGNAASATLILTLAYIFTAIMSSAISVVIYSYIGVVGNNAADRGLLSSRYTLYYNIGGLLYSSAGTAFLTFFVKTLNSQKAGYFVMALFGAVMCFAMYLINFAVTKGYDITEADEAQISGAASAATKKKNLSLGEIFKSIFTNVHFGIHVISQFACTCATTVVQAMTIYYFTYVAENLAMYSVCLTMGTVIGIFAAWVSPFITRKLYTKNTMILALALAVSGIALCAAFGLTSSLMYVIGYGVFYAGVQLRGANTGAMMNDCAIYAKWKNGVDAGAATASIHQMTSLLAALCRTLLIGYALATSGYVAGVEADIAVKKNILSACTRIPLILMSIALIALFFYGLNKEKVEKMEEEISAR